MSARLDVATRLKDKVTVLSVIAEQQKHHPGYCSDVVAAIIDSELCLLAAECGNYFERAERCGETTDVSTSDD
jgi:hypothetical protein